MPIEKIDAMIKLAILEYMPQLGQDILDGQVKGRVVVKISADS